MESLPGSPLASSIIGPIGSRVSSFLHALQYPVAGYRARRDEKEGGVGADALGLLNAQELPSSQRQLPVEGGCNKRPILSASSAPAPPIASYSPNTCKLNDGHSMNLLVDASASAPVVALLQLHTSADANSDAGLPPQQTHIPQRRRQGRHISAASRNARVPFPGSLMRFLPCHPYFNSKNSNSSDNGFESCSSRGGSDADSDGSRNRCHSSSSCCTAGGVFDIDDQDDEDEDEDEDAGATEVRGADRRGNMVSCGGRRRCRCRPSTIALCGLVCCCGPKQRRSHSKCVWTVEAVSAAPQVGCTGLEPGEYAGELQRLMFLEPSLWRTLRRAARAALAGKLFEFTFVLRSPDAAIVGMAPQASAGSWRDLPYIQIITCLLPQTTSVGNRERCNGLPYSTVARGGRGSPRRALGLRITHSSMCMEAVAAAAGASAVALGGDATLAVAVAAAAAAQQTRLSVKSLAADMAQGLITVIDYTSGAILYQNRNSQAYMGVAPPPDVMIAVEAREQQLLMQQQQQQQQGASRKVLLPGSAVERAGPTRRQFHVSLVLRELLRHEAGALERLQACLEAGEEFEETVQVPATLSPFLASLKAFQKPLLPSDMDMLAAAPAGEGNGVTAPAGTNPLSVLPAVVPVTVSSASGSPSGDSGATSWRTSLAAAAGMPEAAAFGAAGSAGMPPPPRAQQAASCFIRNTSSGRMQLQHHYRLQQQQQPSEHLARLAESSGVNSSTNGDAAPAAAAAAVAPTPAVTQAPSHLALGISICSGTSRLGRMARSMDTPPGSVPSGLGDGNPHDMESGAAGRDAATPASPEPVAASTAHATAAATSPSQADGVFDAGGVSLLLLPPPVNIPLRKWSSNLGLKTSSPAVTPDGWRPAESAPVGAVASSLADATTAVTASAIISGGSTSPTRNAGQSPISSLARRMTRFLGRANTFAARSAVSQCSGNSITAAAAVTSGNIVPSAANSATSSAFSLGPLRTLCGHTAKATGLPWPGGGGVGGGSHAAQSQYSVMTGVDVQGEAIRDIRMSGSSTLHRVSSSTAAAAPTAVGTVRDAGGTHATTISEGFLWTFMRARGSKDSRRQSQQLPSPQPRPPTPPTQQLALRDNRSSRTITGRASTGSCNLSHVNLNVIMNEQRAATTVNTARSVNSNRWSIGANPRLTAYESAPATAGASSMMEATMAAFGGFKTGTAHGFRVDSPGGITGLPLPTPSQRRYGAFSPRAPGQSILVSPRRPAPIHGALSTVAVNSAAAGGIGVGSYPVSGFFSGLAGGSSMLDGSMGAVGPAALAAAKASAEGSSRGGGGGGELQVASRSNSMLKAIMSLPERSHFFNRRRKSAAARGGGGTLNGFSQCSLHLRVGSTGGYCPGRDCRSAAAGMAASIAAAAAGGSSLYEAPTSCGGRTNYGEGPMDAEPIANLYGGVEAGPSIDNMSDLEASPYALRVDSVTALKSTRTRRPPPRRASSHSSLLQLKDSAAATAASSGAAAPVECFIGPFTHRQFQCNVPAPPPPPPPADDCPAHALQPSNGRIDPTSTLAVATAADAAVTAPCTPTDTLKNTPNVDPSASDVAQWRSSEESMPTGSLLPFNILAGDIAAAAAGVIATGDSAIEAAIATSRSNDGSHEGLTARDLAFISKPPLKANLRHPASAKAQAVASVVPEATQPRKGLEAKAEATTTKGEVAAMAVDAVAFEQPTESCEATVQSLLAALQVLKEDVQSLPSSTCRNSLPVCYVSGTSSSITRNVEGLPWRRLSPKSAMGTAVAAGTADSSRGVASQPRPTSLLSLQLRFVNSSSGSSGSSGSGTGDRGHLADFLGSPFSADAAGVAATAAGLVPSLARFHLPGPLNGMSANTTAPVCTANIVLDVSSRLEPFLPPAPSGPLAAPTIPLIRDVTTETCTGTVTDLTTPDATILMVTDSGEVVPKELMLMEAAYTYKHHAAHCEDVSINSGSGGDQPTGAQAATTAAVEAAAAGAWLNAASDGGAAAGMPSATSIVAAAAAVLMDATALRPSRPRVSGTATSASISLNFQKAKLSALGAAACRKASDTDRSERSAVQNRCASRSSGGGSGVGREPHYSALETLSLNLNRLGPLDLKCQSEHGRSCNGIGIEPLMKSGSFTAGVPFPAVKGHLPLQSRRPFVRQSTHDRIEQLLEIARNMGASPSACELASDGGAGGVGAVASGTTAAGISSGEAGISPSGGITGAAAAAAVGPIWHSVHVCVCSNPATGVPVLVVTQYDVTQQMDARSQLTMLLEREQKILESIFPRHVIEYLTTQQHLAPSDNIPRVTHPSTGNRSKPRLSGEAVQQRQGDGPGGGAAGASATPGSAIMSSSGGGGAAGGLLARYRSSVAQLASVATAHPGVTILFADIVGFTSMCKQVTPLEVMTFLNKLYSRFDAILDIYKVYKVETIGDCFMVAGGLVAQDEEGWRTTITHDRLHAVRVLAFAKAMLQEAHKVHMPTGGPVLMRVGIHSGPVMSGVVGSRMPRFCVFGDTVNTASRMESTSRPGRIHVSEDTHELLPNERWEPTGGVEVKGKGVMPTYLWASDLAEDKGEQLHRVLGVYL